MSKSLSSIKSTETKDDPFNSKIYKVKHLVDSKINTIYVFNVIRTTEEDEEEFGFDDKSPARRESNARWNFPRSNSQSDSGYNVRNVRCYS